MTRLTVRVRNDEYDRRDRVAYYVPPYHEYTGEVYPNPPWVKEDSFCLTTGDSQFPFRVISKENIIHGWLLSSRAEAEAPAPSTTTYQVQGKGKTYLVTKDARGKLSCNCTGFSYRRTCSHVKEIEWLIT
jgi:hypothetical protein